MPHLHPSGIGRPSSMSRMAADVSHGSHELFAVFILVNLSSCSIQGSSDELQCIIHAVLIKPQRVLHQPLCV